MKKEETAVPMGLEPAELDAADMAKYLMRIGRGLSCRLDVPILSLEDLKWASTVFSNLSRCLRDLAHNDNRQEVIRVIAGRYAMESAKSELHHRNHRKGVIKKITKARSAPYETKHLGIGGK